MYIEDVLIGFSRREHSNGVPSSNARYHFDWVYSVRKWQRYGRIYRTLFALPSIHATMKWVYTSFCQENMWIAVNKHIWFDVATQQLLNHQQPKLANLLFLCLDRLSWGQVHHRFESRNELNGRSYVHVEIDRPLLFKDASNIWNVSPVHFSIPTNW